MDKQIGLVAIGQTSSRRKLYTFREIILRTFVGDMQMDASALWDYAQRNEAGQLLAWLCAEYCAVNCSTAGVTPTTLCFVSLSPLPRRHVMVHGTTSVIVAL
jgi:hypothetical protein